MESRLARGFAFAASFAALLLLSARPAQARPAADGVASDIGTLSIRGTRADEAPVGEDPTVSFERPFAVALYATGQGGAYTSGGLGGRLRWEVISGLLGIEFYGEALYVEHPTRLRHDYPIGASLYVPIRLAHILRLKLHGGACARFSFIEPATEHGPRGDSISFGPHAGVGLELSLGRFVALSLDTRATGYIGNAQATDRWTTDIGDGLSMTGNFEVALALQVHLGRP